MAASPKSFKETCEGSWFSGTTSRIRPSSTSIAAVLIPCGVTTRRERKALRLIFRACTTSRDYSQQQGTATIFNSQGVRGSAVFPRKFSDSTQSESVIIAVVENTPTTSGRIQGALWDRREHLPGARPRDPDCRAHRLQGRLRASCPDRILLL